MNDNLRVFAGGAKDAESTVLPSLASWVDEVFADSPECRAAPDHGVMVWANLPSCGVMSVHKYEWCITAISNFLALHRKNGIAIVVHPNRGQVAERTGFGKHHIMNLHCFGKYGKKIPFSESKT